MKKFTIIFIISLLAISSQNCRSTYKISEDVDNPYSIQFSNSDKLIDTVLTFSFPNYTKTMRVKNKWWKITINQKVNGKLFGESTINYYCTIECNDIFNKMISIGLLNLPNESELSYMCRATTDTTISGERLIEIREMGEDVSKYKIEYKIGKKEKALLYKDPKEALKICPSSEERKKFLEIIDLVKDL